jgi:hypothetical protein
MSACKKDNSENTGNGTGSQQIQLTSYPLTIGNSWEYYTESHVADSTGAIWLSDYYTNYWNALSDTIINGIVCTKISQLDSNYDGSTHLAYTYYANRSDGFYGIAVQNNGGMFYLKTNEILKLTQFDLLGSFGNKTFSNDTAFLPATSLKLLKFPSNTNDIWLSHEYNNPIPDIIKRKYICDTTISTSAGTFNCKKLQMFWDIDNNNLPDSGYSEIYQYFSTKGLIQEEWNEALIFGGSSGIDSLHRITKLVHVNF